jgi:predicted acylesterase/phospholipase RssA
VTGLSFASIDGLQKQFERWIDYPTLLESPLDLSFIVLNLSRGEGQFVSNRQDHSAADLRKLVTAGYSIPILFPPVAYRGEWYVDGGLPERADPAGRRDGGH